jgi:hypothetical protein
MKFTKVCEDCCVLTEKMPRFGDVFAYSEMSNCGQNYTVCYLLKRVGKFPKSTRIERILFDTSGLLLYFEIPGEPVHGPFCLTTVDDT